MIWFNSVINNTSTIYVPKVYLKTELLKEAKKHQEKISTGTPIKIIPSKLSEDDDLI